MTYSLSDFDFELPADLIAQHPAQERSGSRLLIARGGSIRDGSFPAILDQVNPGDVLVFNNSKVIPARLYGLKPTGGRVEILVERLTGLHTATALMKASKKIQPDTVITLASPENPASPLALTETLTVLGRDAVHEDRFQLRFERPVLDVLQTFGEIPLPPYIQHHATEEDKARYQTVYAQYPGSVAAPTAGLHFDQTLLQQLTQKGAHLAWVTLHVGSGTFAPVRTEDLNAHQMHSEWCEVPEATAALIAQAKQEAKRVIAVGTTSLRTLESGAVQGQVRAGAWETELFIRPGYTFQVTDALITNFHLPKSTLLMLVAAFMGYDKMRAVYRHAIEARYRFFSYGDAMFCEKEAR